MLVFQLTAVYMVVSLIVPATAQEMEIPLAGKPCLQARLARVLDSIVYHQALFTQRQEKRLGEAYRQRTQRACSPHLAVACQPDSDAALVLPYLALVGDFYKVSLFLEAYLRKIC